jgi:hypothetical protein
MKINAPHKTATKGMHVMEFPNKHTYSKFQTSSFPLTKAVTARGDTFDWCKFCSILNFEQQAS